MAVSLAILPPEPLVLITFNDRPDLLHGPLLLSVWPLYSDQDEQKTGDEVQSGLHAITSHFASRGGLNYIRCTNIGYHGLGVGQGSIGWRI